MKHIYSQLRTTSLLLISASLLTACSTADRLSKIGQAPEVSKIDNPLRQSKNRSVSIPLPEEPEYIQNANSLWVNNKTGIFDDQRANRVGDIITVLINIDDGAELENESERSRSSGEDADLNSLLGYETSLNRLLPESVDNVDLTQFGSTSTSSGEGSIEREEEITVRMAAMVTQRLPNGNLVLQGRQEVAVNFEKRVIEVAGIIRPEDVSIGNTINFDQIAEGRINYGGEGQITDVQQPRYGQQIYDILFPF